MKPDLDAIRARLSAYVDKTRALRDQAKQERDAALEEVATAAKYCDELAETIRMHIAREIELEAEVERLREREREAMAVAHTQIELHLSAYRRGAETMREACARRVTCLADACPCQGKKHAANIRALPIPEER